VQFHGIVLLLSIREVYGLAPIFLMGIFQCNLELGKKFMVFGWMKSNWAAVRNALSSTRRALTQAIRSIFKGSVDEALLEQLEEILIGADLGVGVTKTIIDTLRRRLKSNPKMTIDELLSFLEESLVAEMAPLDTSLRESSEGPTVLLIVGANGSGKTTSIAKLAYALKAQKKNVLLAAADTFRAAAQEQLRTWAERLDVDIVTSAYQADPAAVAFDAISAARSRGVTDLIIDTAGRLENKSHLLKELEKIVKTCQKAQPGAPHEILLVLDATVGQNGVEQARAFHQSIGLTGLILTKLDGSAKGGVVIAVQKQLGLPVKFIGVGESLDALIPFDPRAFVHDMLFDKE
jgi:fused signal recognition particle receptor